MKSILILITTFGLHAHGVTPETRADLALLRAEARTLLANFNGGPLDTPRAHRRGIKHLIDQLVRINNREWVDPQVRELLSILDAPVTLSIASPVDEPIRRQQIWNLFFFAAQVGERCDEAPWRRTVDANILVDVACAAMDGVSSADPRRKMAVESDRLNYLRGEITLDTAPDLDRFLGFVAASLGRVTPAQRQALLWRVIETYFEIEDQLDANCAKTLSTTL